MIRSSKKNWWTFRWLLLSEHDELGFGKLGFFLMQCFIGIWVDLGRLMKYMRSSKVWSREMKVMEREMVTSVMLWLILVYHPLTRIHANTEGV
uniref:Uncharacterized protein n=1 Tax=Nelumbo nucifera TaxID=4432 RepID=A0A822Z0M5_NELNU|nr:TPA_asm: hypothetical protein HUJ06_005668 [Nelumbo nucifera]